LDIRTVTAPLKIGIPVLNRGDLLRRLVMSVDLDAEILVILNCMGPVDPSTEDAVGELEQGGRVRVDRIAGNLGVAGSWNRILSEFGGDCLICNNDIEFTAGVLRESMECVARKREIVIHHLWAAACFYVTLDFPKVMGWFDENIYPAYHEDQEIALRGAALGVPRAIIEEAKGRIMHAGSETRRNASQSVQNYIRKAKRISGEYLRRRWGALPSGRGRMPEKQHPFDEPAMHAADWNLDFKMRRSLTQLCEDVTGFHCPLQYHRSEGGLCS
jgi:GT2 family glycosyltransferase